MINPTNNVFGPIINVLLLYAFLKIFYFNKYRNNYNIMIKIENYSFNIAEKNKNKLIRTPV